MASLLFPSSLLSLQPPFSSPSSQVQCLKRGVFAPRDSISPSVSSSSSSVPSSSTSNLIPQVVVTRERGKNKQIIKTLEKHGITSLELSLIQYSRETARVFEEAMQSAEGSLHVAFTPSKEKMPSLTQNDLQSGDQSRQSEAPAGLSPVICFFIEKTALLVAQKGSEYEKSLMAEGNIHPDWSFLWSSDPYHGYYQQKISEARNQQPDDIKAPLRYRPKEAPKLTAMRPGYKPLKLEAMKLPESCHKDPRKHEYITYGEPQAPYLVKLPQGITRKELYTIKLTAQFVARHGMNFQSNLMIKKRDMDDSRFEFMNQTDCRFDYFNRLSAAYAKEMPPRNRNAPSACTATVLDGFFRLLERDSREELEEMESQKKGVVEYQEALEKETKGVEVALIDPPELVLLSQLGYPKRVMDRPPEEPEPKRHKPALVPEDQFLAQHQGSSTISVAVPNGQVIEITVHSLSENVASLKEKIAAEIQIPASKHKLSGTAGFLEDSMSLAHYNVGAGEILTLSL